MKKIVLTIFLTIITCTIFPTDPLSNLRKDPSREVQFVILITSYNNENFCLENLDSVAHLTSSHPYSIIVVDDCSTDATGELMDYYVDKYNLRSFITVIHNKKRVGALANIYNTIHKYIPDHKIVVSVDGDDKLISDYVLLRLEQEYQNPDIWLTYGQHIESDSQKIGTGHPVPRKTLELKKVRTMYPFPAHHLRTFKAGLFKKIKKDDLLHEGIFFQTTWDLAIMYPMIEMCAPINPGGTIHCIYIPDPLYIYNRNNPLSDFRIHRDDQIFMRKIIDAKAPYDPIAKL